MMQASQEQKIGTNAQFFYKRPSLEKEVEAKLKGPPKYVQLSSLTVTYWCDVPKGLWEKFNENSVFASSLHSHVNDLTDRLVGEWAKRQIHWERLAAEAEENGDTQGVEHAKSEFAKDCEALQKECEKVAVEDIAEFFTSTAATYADYRRYKFKAGAKLAFTFVGIAISIAALSTAATPAAPATIVPAIIGIVVAAASAGKQIADLSASAEEIEAEIRINVGSIKASYKDEKGKAKKKTFAAKDFTSGFVSGLTGGVSDIVFPSISSLMSLNGMHKSKLDGLSVALGEMGTALNALVTAMDAAGKVLDDNEKALEQAKSKPGVNLKKIQKGVNSAKKAFEELKDDFVASFENDIPTLMKRVETGRANNARMKEALDKINEAVGSKNWGLAGNLFATIALTGIGFASGAPSNFAEKVTMGLGPGWTALDTLREYTPDIMEEALG